MGVSIRDRTTVFTAIDEVAEGLINMVQQAPDLAVRVPSTPDWTVGQVFAHVVTVAPRYCRGPRQLGRWTEHTGELRDLNADELATLDTTDIAALVGRLRAAIDEFARCSTSSATTNRATESTAGNGSAPTLRPASCWASSSCTDTTSPGPCTRRGPYSDAMSNSSNRASPPSCRAGSTPTAPPITQQRMRCNYADKAHTASRSTTGR
jgi:Mycothiol maleylpyruvate isomerase N-terminal domain